MPLPDERPRASVANLIGRFEQQTKRQSIGATNGGRTNVATHNTGDSVKEEVKEKREWPPKPAQNDKPSPPILPPSSSSTKESPRVVAEPIPLSESVVEAAQAAPETEPVKTVPPATLTSRSQRQSTIGSPAKPSSTALRTHSSPIKVLPAKESQKVPSTARSPPTTSNTNPAPPPMKPQHTGQSTTSITATSRRTATKHTATPVRPKTPSRASMGTAKIQTPTRPKTPSTASARPKTPSSHLFAPTAASLAKARNAPEPKPTPVKKTTLSANAADRLSKPTAASLSKARSPVPISPAPSRGGTKPVAMRGTASTRGTAKSAVTTRAKPTVEGTKTAAKATGAAAGAALAAGVVAVASGSEGEDNAHKVAEEPDVKPGEDTTIEEINGHLHDKEPSGSTNTTEPVEVEVPIEPVAEAEGVDDVVVDEVAPEVTAELHDEPSDVTNEAEAVQSTEETQDSLDAHVADSNAGLVEEEPVQEAEPSVENKDDEHVPNDTEKEVVGEPESEPSEPANEVEQRLDEVKTRPVVDDDLVAMVNMLESKPATTFHPETTASIPDEEVQEIPDEE